MPAPTARPNTKSQQAGLCQLQSLLMHAYSAPCNVHGMQHVAKAHCPRLPYPASISPCSAVYQCIWPAATLLLVN